MNKDTVCKDCGKHFTEKDGIYVINPETGEPYVLCVECFNHRIETDSEFREWFEKDTAILKASVEEQFEHFDEFQNCSYYTEFEDEGDED